MVKCWHGCVVNVTEDSQANWAQAWNLVNWIVQASLRNYVLDSTRKYVERLSNKHQAVEAVGQNFMKWQVARVNQIAASHIALVRIAFLVLAPTCVGSVSQISLMSTTSVRLNVMLCSALL